MDASHSPPIDICSSRPSSRLLGSDFRFFARCFARRYFDPIPYAEQDAQRLAQLCRQGEVVHIMRSVGVLNFLYLAYYLLRSALPPVRAAIGLRFSFFSPFRRLFRQGSVHGRLNHALDSGASALVFLREPTGLLPGPKPGDDPFVALISRARQSIKPIFLVPDLFLWLARPRNVRPNIRDLVFGNPETPGKVITAWSFLLNFRTAFFRVGNPINLTEFVRQNAADSDQILVRKVRGALFHHLARETQAIVGPPLKHPDRIIAETLRDRGLRSTLDKIAIEKNISADAVRRRARHDLAHIANRYTPTMIAVFRTMITMLVARLYQGVDINEKEIARILELKREAPLVFCPSHKSHLDSMIVGWAMGDRGIVPPLVFSGANLSFWPLGWIFRRASAFFGRRTFKDDPIHKATFKAYVKKLVREGYSQEFFIEGTRSRTGRLASPKLGMLSYQVDAFLEGARHDIYLVPVAIDYDKVVEARSYAKEMAGIEKKPESIKTLLAFPKIFTSARFGRIYISFGSPISLRKFLESRIADPANMTEEERRSAVVALGQHTAYCIGRTMTLTPVAALSAAILAQWKGISANRISVLIDYLRAAARQDNLRTSPLENVSSSPLETGPIQDVTNRFIKDEIIKIDNRDGETIYLVPEDKRFRLELYKNNIVHFFATRSFAAFALFSLKGEGTIEQLRERFLFLLRLLKYEFSFRAGLHEPEPLFQESLAALVNDGLLIMNGQQARALNHDLACVKLAFLRSLTSDLIEGYRALISQVPNLTVPTDRKALVTLAREHALRQIQRGTISNPEAASRRTLENAIALSLDQKILVEAGEKKVLPAPAYQENQSIASLLATIDRYLVN